MQIRQALTILDEHNLLQIHSTPHSPRVSYSLRPSSVLRLSRFARCSLVAKTLYGEVGEGVIEELLSRGRVATGVCCQRVAERLEAGSHSHPGFISICLDWNAVKGAFCSLASAQFIMRCARVLVPSSTSPSTRTNPMFELVVDPFLVPDVIEKPATALVGQCSALPHAVMRCRKWRERERHEEAQGES